MFFAAENLEDRVRERKRESAFTSAGLSMGALKPIRRLIATYDHNGRASLQVAAPLAQTATLGYADKNALRYYQRHTSPDLEDAIISSDRGVESVALARTEVSASLDTQALARYALTQPNAVMYHQHPANPAAVVRMALAAGNRELARRLLHTPPESPLFTTIYRIPSIADLTTALSVQAIGYTAHNKPLAQRIAVMDDGKPIRVVDYGLSPKGRATYRSLVTAAFSAAERYKIDATRANHDAMTRAGRQFAKYVNGQLDAYQKELDTFHREMLAWKPGQPELGAEQFYRRVSATTDFAISDLGEHGEPVAVTEYARAVRDAAGYIPTQAEQRQLRRREQSIPPAQAALGRRAEPLVIPVRPDRALPYAVGPRPSLPALAPPRAAPYAVSPQYLPRAA